METSCYVSRVYFNHDVHLVQNRYGEMIKRSLPVDLGSAITNLAHHY